MARTDTDTAGAETRAQEPQGPAAPAPPDPAAVPEANQIYADTTAVTAQGTGPDLDAIRVEAANRKARYLMSEAEREAQDAAKREMEQLQRETEIVPQEQEAVTVLNGGNVKLRYLGTSTRFDFGVDEESGQHVYGVAGGEPVSVTREVADAVLALPYDKFEEIK